MNIKNYVIMDKMKKIASLLEKLELTPQEVVTDWICRGEIDLKQIQIALSQKQKETVFVTSKKEIDVGMFLYSDGKISTTYTEGKSIALVLDINQDKGTMLMMCLHKEILPFSTHNFNIDTVGLKSGMNATHFISQMVEDADNASVEAVQYCLDYSDAFVEQGQAFLMTVDEVKALEPNLVKICSALHAAGISNGGFWLSTVAPSEKDAEAVNAQVAMFMPDRVSIQKEYASIPQDVYPVYDLRFSQLDLKN